MSENLKTLNIVVDSVKKNREGVAAQLIASTKAYGNPPPDVEAAINLLIKHYGSNVQLIGHAIGAKLQIEQLEKTSIEINALVATLEIALADEQLEAKLTQQMTADALRAQAALNAGTPPAQVAVPAPVTGDLIPPPSA